MEETEILTKKWYGHQQAGWHVDGKYHPIDGPVAQTSNLDLEIRKFESRVERLKEAVKSLAEESDAIAKSRHMGLYRGQRLERAVKAIQSQSAHLQKLLGVVR
jgi:DNA repair exonuclease SbcCD ATPase subunit